MNRSTIYDFLLHDSGLEQRYWKINHGNYPVFIAPYTWNHSYLLVDGVRFSDFEVLILFSNELVIKFDSNISNNRQVNIPYRLIDCIEVREDLDIGYIKLENGEKIVK